MPTDKRAVTRRELLARAGAAGAGALAAAGLPEALAAAQPLPTKVLGKTGLRVSILGFGGTVQVVPPLLNLALQLGVTYVDTAEAYGSETPIGSILEASGKRKQIILVTKTGDRNPGRMEHNLEASLKRLRTDHVDGFLMHGVDDPELLQNREIRSAVERWKRQGKIRFCGFSHHGSNTVACLETAAKVGWIDAILFVYSFRRGAEAELNRAIDACAKVKLGLIAMKTQGGAATTGRTRQYEQQGFNRWQAALKAVWADQRIHAIASRMETVQQVRDNVAATRQKLTQRETELLARYAQETSHLYCRGCGQHCQPACGTQLDIPGVLRCLMYHDNYGDAELARMAFAGLGAAQRDVTGADLGAAEAACPYGVPVSRFVTEALRKLA